MPWLELKIPPLLLWLATALAMWSVTRAAPGLSFTLKGSAPIALALAATGTALAVAGIVAFRRQRTTVNPLTPDASTSVVSSGVYRVSRNPMYLGFLLTLAGWALYLGNAAAVLFLPAFVAWINRFQIQPEERTLLARFGPEYADYMARVRRWL